VSTQAIPMKHAKPVRRKLSAAESDEQLLLAYREQGGWDVFAQLVHRYERELYSYLRRFLGNASMAEDAFQATFLQIHLKCDQFEEGRKFRPWLYTIATNQAIDLQRRNKRHRMVSLDRRWNDSGHDDMGSLLELLPSEEGSPMGKLEAEERRRLVRRTVDDLPEALRTTVQLVYYQGLKYRDAAETLGIPVGTVKSRLHTAIVKLAESWKTIDAAGEI